MQSTIKALLSIFLFVLLATHARAGVTDDIAALEDQRMAAYLTSDPVPLKKIFADELIYVHSSGIADSKQQIIESFTSNDLKIHKFDREDTKVREIGDLMLATAIGNIELTYKGKDLKIKLRYSALYKKNPSGWQIVYYQGTRLP